MLSVLKGIVIKKLLQKKCYKIGKHTNLYSTSELINPSNIDDNIIVGDFCHIRGELLLFGHGGKIEMGDYCYVGLNTHIWSAKSIIIGNRVLISHNCNIFDNDTHPLDPEARHKQFKEIITKGQPKSINLNEREIVIEDDVLIAANSIILKGIRIGKAAIVGAGSVVTDDVPPYAVVAGNPAKIVRYIQRKNTIG
jgi:acetyltransferase-like isoleucine patch superfamily enzyme